MEVCCKATDSDTPFLGLKIVKTSVTRKSMYHSNCISISEYNRVY